MYEPTNIDLLVVDDNEDFRGTVVRRFHRRGLAVEEASCGQAALDLIQQREFDVAILDMVMPDLTGLEVLEKLKETQPECEAILLTGQGTIESAVEAMKLGAYDYLTKPFPLAELEILIQKAYERRQLNKENRQLKALLKRSEPKWDMIGQSSAMLDVYRLIERAGPSDKFLLIQGESGTGKELVARALHSSSSRSEKPMVVINCASMSDSLIESELFGHEKGAFTGAVSAKSGLFEVADGGTLMIDEIGEMPASMQAKLLRVLEDGWMRRVGSVQERRVNVRLLSATNRDLKEEVEAGRFREDLYYRINVMTIELPPLRIRTGDVALLTSSFLGPDWSIEESALPALESFSWPGNVRQLSHVIDRAKILAEDNIVRLCDLPAEITESLRSPASGETQGSEDFHYDRLDDLEREKVLEVLKRERGNKARAARTLGITRRSLYRLIQKYDLTDAIEKILGLQTD
ncbi:MAG: sigma-54 dependent transcriptional regulator [Planctomycetes bacterium]|nr:sigma-54 dependent transcriptional regulator [Planctomycetota bacterium]MCH9727060.1 sigma-54 dependent transcriptional regulator [Planctomycetota bacterium]MCH9775003.1 sigma-54 dependent transcriptional regulator [Planctomycetota bacterium]MCH9789502.1 sigma-54 dependent transcriptional regulator [Planctomycetota bacterium]